MREEYYRVISWLWRGTSFWDQIHSFFFIILIIPYKQRFLSERRTVSGCTFITPSSQVNLFLFFDKIIATFFAFGQENEKRWKNWEKISGPAVLSETRERGKKKLTGDTNFTYYSAFSLKIGMCASPVMVGTSYSSPYRRGCNIREWSSNRDILVARSLCQSKKFFKPSERECQRKW